MLSTFFGWFIGVQRTDSIYSNIPQPRYQDYYRRAEDLLALREDHRGHWEKCGSTAAKKEWFRRQWAHFAGIFLQPDGANAPPEAVVAYFVDQQTDTAFDLLLWLDCYSSFRWAFYHGGLDGAVDYLRKTPLDPLLQFYWLGYLQALRQRTLAQGFPLAAVDPADYLCTAREYLRRLVAGPSRVRKNGRPNSWPQKLSRWRKALDSLDGRDRRRLYKRFVKLFDGYAAGKVKCMVLTQPTDLNEETADLPAFVFAPAAVSAESSSHRHFFQKLVANGLQALSASDWQGQPFSPETRALFLQVFAGHLPPAVGTDLASEECILLYLKAQRDRALAEPPLTCYETMLAYEAQRSRLCVAGWLFLLTSHPLPEALAFPAVFPGDPHYPRRLLQWRRALDSLSWERGRNDPALIDALYGVFCQLRLALQVHHGVLYEAAIYRRPLRQLMPLIIC